MPEFVDRVLKYMDCGDEFIFTAGEQLFFHEIGRASCRERVYVLV